MLIKRTCREHLWKHSITMYVHTMYIQCGSGWPSMQIDKQILSSVSTSARRLLHKRPSCQNILSRVTCMVYQVNNICLSWNQYFFGQKAASDGVQVLINGKIFVELMVVGWKSSINQVLARQPVNLNKQIWITLIERPTRLLCIPGCSRNPPASATCQSFTWHGGVSIMEQLP